MTEFGSHQTSQFRVKICRHFQQGRCTFGDGCQFSHDSTKQENQNDYYPKPSLGNDGAIKPYYSRERAFAMMKADQRGEPIIPYKKHQRTFTPKKICRHFLSGTCSFGDGCNFSHDGQVTQTNLNTHIKKEAQNYYGEGNTSIDEVLQPSSLLGQGLLDDPTPIQKSPVTQSLKRPYIAPNIQKEKIHTPKRKCKWFQVGKCTYGDKCGFLHEMGDLTAKDISSTKELFQARINPNMKVDVYSKKDNLMPVKRRSALLGECPSNMNPKYKHMSLTQLQTEVDRMKVKIKETESVVEQKKILDLAKDDEDIRIVDDIFQFNYDQNFVSLLRYRNNDVLGKSKKSVSPPVLKRRKRRSRSKSPKSRHKKRRKSHSSSPDELKSRVKIVMSSRKRVEDEMNKLSRITKEHALEERAYEQMQVLQYKKEQEEKWKKEQAERVYSSMKRDIEQEIAGMMQMEMGRGLHDKEIVYEKERENDYGSDDDFFRDDDPVIPDRGIEQAQEYSSNAKYNDNQYYSQNTYSKSTNITKYADYSHNSQSYGPQY